MMSQRDAISLVYMHPCTYMTQSARNVTFASIVVIRKLELE